MAIATPPPIPEGYDYTPHDQATARSIVDRARASADVFGEFCFGHVQQPLHERWNEIWDSHPRSSIWAPPEHGKTYHGVFVRFIWELGKNPNLQLMHVSATGVVPEGTLLRAAEHIAKNERIHLVFPNLQIEKVGLDRGQNRALWLKRPRGHTDRDPNWVALGSRNQIHGRRLDGVVLDDILDFENTYTPGARVKTRRLLSNTILGRLSAWGWLRALGYPFFKDDPMAWWAERPDTFHEAFDVTESVDHRPGPPGLWPLETVDPVTGRPYGWPWERVLQKEREVDDLDWMTQWRCRLPDEAMALFPWVILRQALDQGRGLELFRDAPPGIVPVSGIDPATGDGSDETVITTGYTSGGFSHTLDVRGGLWDEVRLFSEMLKVLRRYPNHGGFLIEDNAFQRLLVRTLARPDTMASYGWTPADIDRCRVEGYTTGREKHSHSIGVRGLQIDFKNGRTVLPAQADGRPWAEVRRLTTGLNEYDPQKKAKHVSDYVMSYWLCREMQRRLGQLAERRPRV